MRTIEELRGIAVQMGKPLEQLLYEIITDYYNMVDCAIEFVGSKAFMDLPDMIHLVALLRGEIDIDEFKGDTDE